MTLRLVTNELFAAVAAVTLVVALVVTLGLAMDAAASRYRVIRPCPVLLCPTGQPCQVAP